MRVVVLILVCLSLQTDMQGVTILPLRSSSPSLTFLSLYTLSCPTPFPSFTLPYFPINFKHILQVVLVSRANWSHPKEWLRRD